MQNCWSDFNNLLAIMQEAGDDHNQLAIFNSRNHFSTGNKEQKLNAAFLIALCGEHNKLFDQAMQYLKEMSANQDCTTVANFYLNGLAAIQGEIGDVCFSSLEFQEHLGSVLQWFKENKQHNVNDDVSEKLWTLFFPEGVGLRQDTAEKIKTLREKRRIRITHLNKDPITDAIGELVFTSNILLTIPSKNKKIRDLPLSSDLKRLLKKIVNEPQKYWYDHPIQIGVEPDQNEFLYGLKALDVAVGFEKKRNKVREAAKLTCLLSISVTHEGLHDIARSYLEQEFKRAGGFDNLRIFLFTETEVQQLIENVLVTAADIFCENNEAKEYLKIIGVDGEYGRHYSFLKAIIAFWAVFIDSRIRGTFKIDLDQVFPQEELVNETGFSAFEHFQTPLWGARGLEANGNLVELGMIAGALVNQKDIKQSLFTPDVTFSQKILTFDEQIFYSPLPQSISTQAEMMTCYNNNFLDGKNTCIQRIHVTGGTNGILVDHLMRFRPFTPSFIGRAEDQAYIMSVLKHPQVKLAYLHKDGLIMRHDKEAFAQEAIKTAATGKLVGDYMRILLFSAYAHIIADDIDQVKEILNPFTGCFISKIPITLVLLRFALKAARFFNEDLAVQGADFIHNGIKRLSAGIDFISGEDSKFKRLYNFESRAWNLYYDLLESCKEELKFEDPAVLRLQQQAKTIITDCMIANTEVTE